MEKQMRPTSANRPTQSKTAVSAAGTRVPVKSASQKVASQIDLQRRKELAHRKAVREPKFVTLRKKRADRAPFPIGLVLILILITAMFLFMMMNYAEIDQYNGQVRDLRREVANLKAEQDKLDEKLGLKDNRAEFDRYATEQLGMVDGKTLNRVVVTISPEDKTEIMEYDYEQTEGTGFLLSGLAEVVRDFFS